MSSGVVPFMNEESKPDMIFFKKSSICVNLETCKNDEHIGFTLIHGSGHSRGAKTDEIRKRKAPCASFAFLAFIYRKEVDSMRRKRKFIFLLVLWLILLAMTIAELAIGVKPEDCVGEFLGLASPLIVYLTSRKRRLTICGD